MGLVLVSILFPMSLGYLHGRRANECAKISINRLITWVVAGSMGLSSDPRAVVDSKAKVIGVNSLRVVDASAFPLLPPGHLMATVCEHTLPPY